MDKSNFRPDAYRLYKSVPLVDTDESAMKGPEQGAANGLFGGRWVDESGSLAKPTSELDCIVPGCRYHKADQTISGRNVSHSVTTGCEAGDVARGTVKETFTPEEAAQNFRNTIEELIHSYKYEKIKKTTRFYGDDKRNEVIEIFIDFILNQEGLVNDRGFTVENSPGKYVAGKPFTQERLQEIQSWLKKIFAERAEKKRSYYDKLSYSLHEMLADYLNKKNDVPNDVIPNSVRTILDRHIFTYEQLLHDIFPFSETLLGEKCHFSDFVSVFDFAVKFRQHLVNSGSFFCTYENLLTVGLRANNHNMREYFNRQVIDGIFKRRCVGIINTMFEGGSLPIDGGTKSVTGLNLKIGEELEYDVLDQNAFGDLWHRLGDIFVSRLRKKGELKAVDFPGGCYSFDNDFAVKPFYDTNKWFEINCTPYHSDDQRAKLCFEKVIEVIDSMRNDGLIGYSSGHKHVDALSATQGDIGVLLALECEIQRNPFLLRAFGNNDRIVQNHESKWYKTFADYNPDTKSFAVNRLNWMVDRYNRKTKECCSEKKGSKGITDSEKMDKLKEFAHFYSQFVHMSTIQKGLGLIGDNHMEKYMAMSLLHITGAEKVKELSTLEFRFFRCPKTATEIQRINQFLQAWFQYIHEFRKDGTPLELIPEDIKSCKDYTAEETQDKTINYLRKLGLEPEDYRCFWGEVRDIPSEPCENKPQDIAKFKRARLDPSAF